MARFKCIMDASFDTLGKLILDLQTGKFYRDPYDLEELYELFIDNALPRSVETNTKLLNAINEVLTGEQ